MSITATIKSKTQDGNAVHLIVEKSGPDKARLTAKTYSVPPEPPASAVAELSDAKLYGVKVSADLNTIMCQAEAPGPDPRVTIVVSRPPDAPMIVTITVAGTMFGWGDRVDKYALTDTDFASIRDFVTAAQYPTA